MTQTVIFGARETDVRDAVADGDRLWVPLDDLPAATGYEAKPQGLCHGDLCVPIPAGRRAAWLDEGGRRLDVAAFAGHLGHTLARDTAQGIWSFGPAVSRNAWAGSGPVEAPDVMLPDLDGRMHSLSGQRGKKVLLYCWASW